MRTLILSLVLLLSCHLVDTQKGDTFYPSLKLKSVHQLIMTDTLNFDFSGIVQKDDSIFVVADKPWNTYIYSIAFNQDGWFVDAQRAITSTEKFDLEAIDFSDGNFYLANEYTGSVNLLVPGATEIQPIPINFDAHGLAPGTWKNAGWEGLAIDATKKTMYLTKERQPRFIIAVDMATWTIKEQFDIPQTESNDFSDAKFHKGHLYLLERNGNYVTKINPKTKKVLAKYHYRHIASHPKGKLYEPEKYGMAEALLLTENEIWIGIDNNGLDVSDYAQQAYRLKAKAPAILKFERPKDF